MVINTYVYLVYGAFVEEKVVPQVAALLDIHKPEYAIHEDDTYLELDQGREVPHTPYLLKEYMVDMERGITPCFVVLKEFKVQVSRQESQTPLQVEMPSMVDEKKFITWLEQTLGSSYRYTTQMITVHL